MALPPGLVPLVGNFLNEDFENPPFFPILKPYLGETVLHTPF